MSKELEQIFQYRDRLIEFGKKYCMDNPDRLGQDDLLAVSKAIFDALNEIDMALGQPFYNTNIEVPKHISVERKMQLFQYFMDWYQIVPTPSYRIYSYVSQFYSKEKYSQILCVGDGENCHIGRRLATKGYNVISMDPVARTEYSGSIGREGGTLKVIKDRFFRNDTEKIEWADLIVGSKIPMCVEDILETSKPAVFNISENPEIHKIYFRGIPIHSCKQFEDLIKQCRGVTQKETPGRISVFIYEGRIKKKEEACI